MKANPILFIISFIAMLVTAILPLIKKDLGVKDDKEVLAKAKTLLPKHKESEGSLTLYERNGDNLLFAGDIIKVNEVDEAAFKLTKISHSITPDSHQQNASFVLA